MLRLLFSALIAATIGTAVFIGGAADAGQLFRWVDENGKVHYGDRIPPQYAEGRREELNNQGVVVDVQERERTQAERAAAAQTRRDAIAAEQAAQDRRRYDRYLTTTFPSVSDMMVVREERLSTIDGRITLTRANVQSTEETLARLTRRRSDLESQGQAVPARLQTQIETYEVGLLEGLRAIRKLEKERTDIVAKFDADITRYLELTRGTISGQSAGN